MISDLKNINRRRPLWALILMIVCVLPLATANAEESLREQVARMKNTPLLRHAQWGLYAAYVDNGQPLIDINGETALTPASTFKLFTTALALETLTPAYRFETLLLYEGTIKNGILHGNLILRGGGDPTLGSDRIDGNPGLDSLIQRWVGAVRRAGIRSIDGHIIADTRHFAGQRTPGAWEWMDIGNYYGAGAGALNIHDNFYHLWFRPGKPGQKARVLRTEPYIPGLIFDNHMLTGRWGSGDQGYIYAAPGQFRAQLRGSIPAGGDFAIRGALPDPALFAVQRLKKGLNENGIPAHGKTLVQHNRFTQKGVLLEKIVSPPLRDIVRVIHRRSFNLYAEAAGKEAARIAGYSADSHGFARALKDFLKKKNIPAVALRANDACGLSSANTVTPRMMVSLLRTAADALWFDVYYGTLSVAGDAENGGFFKTWGRGTMLEGNARVKSGLIGGVRALAGYVSTADDRLIAFCFIAHHHNGSRRNVDEIYKKVLLLLLKQANRR